MKCRSVGRAELPGRAEGNSHRRPVPGIYAVSGGFALVHRPACFPSPPYSGASTSLQVHIVVAVRPSVSRRRPRGVPTPHPGFSAFSLGEAPALRQLIPAVSRAHSAPVAGSTARRNVLRSPVAIARRRRAVARTRRRIARLRPVSKARCTDPAPASGGPVGLLAAVGLDPMLTKSASPDPSAMLLASCPRRSEAPAR